MKLIAKRAAVLLAGAICLSSAWGNSYGYVPLPVPKAEDIVAFSNGLPPGDGTRRRLKEEDVLQYLKEGHNNTDVANWPMRFNAFNIDEPCDGVMTDKAGVVYFWSLVAPKGLRLETEDGKYAYLELK